MKRLIFALSLLLPCVSMAASPTAPVMNFDNNNFNVPAVAILCPPNATLGSTLGACNFGGGTVTTTPTRATTIVTNGGIITANNFQSVLAQNNNRLGCLVYNSGTVTLQWAIGASPTSAQEIPILAGQFGPSCANPGGTIVITDQINLTAATTTGAAWVVFAQ